MQIKVCGIRHKENLDQLIDSSVDYIGFIFYPKSKRFFLDGSLSSNDLRALDKEKVGVFVNEQVEEVLTIAKEYHLDVLQLHGDESSRDCAVLRAAGYQVWKAFPVYDHLPKKLDEYTEYVDAFLFDTKGVDHGGNGVKFDWSVLEQYQMTVPLILSGGIGPEDVERVRALGIEQLIAIDVNSRFEIEPGLKDVDVLKKFISETKK
ncbi:MULTISPECIES: phosphoribosylanthranilate isomerase [Reichenbachiella]|uniref:N-(5'-phosphoribosyl)anthranilate isomerase n=1 Tax=Reichenbachiella agariperforans TaxID=156994 RepID=A0A1M6VNR5_REIAG|nr:MULTISPECIES: phosphoribosylanthranilate isomerase [Reichenbachiella]MBU2914745.1 phosphoribosylanthranilate isomerase [Reichenbachiella agariperforans]RJE75350.1 hypothetical protein BGP76_19875 [Reichenbachiella sp. MSK19-1]SHK83207.1 phosphoribosylanthranilate isomerase [Reichenbachiella agariperforans]